MRNRKNKQKKKKETQGKKKNLNRIYVLTFVVAFCSIVYQLLLAHTISLIAGNAIIWYSITIGVFLGSLGLGAILSGKVRQENVIKKLFLVELSLALFGGLAVCLMHFVQIIDMYFLAHGSAKMAFFFILLGSQAIVFVIGFLSGFELPMLMKIANKYSSEKKVTNRVLGVDYFGSLLGAVLFPLFLISTLKIIAVGFLVAIINMLAAIYIGKVFLQQQKNKNGNLAIGFFLIGFLSLGVLFSGEIEKYFTKKYYYYPQALYDFKSILSLLENAPEIETYRSAYQKIDIIDGQSFSAANIVMDAYTDKLLYEPEFPLGKELYLNGDWQFNSGTEEIYHEYFAHVPILATDMVPKNVLILGGGDGMLTRELLKYKEIEKIIQIDIDSEMIRLSKEHSLLLSMNKGAFFNNRVDLRVGDAYTFVRNSEDKFDAIYMDFPMPVDYNTSRLYSREFYSFVRNRLNDDGFIVLDAPGMTSYTKFNREGLQIIEDGKSPWKEYAYTVAAAGFGKVVPYISQLEKDNEQARILAMEYIFEEYEERPKGEELENMIDEYIHSFIFDSQEGFIFAQKENKGEISFHNSKVGTYLLNEKRFKKAFELNYNPIDEIEWQYVNSVMKPTLPKRNFWQVRFPYYVQ
ncbi:hypothetical protein HN784_01375 [bacterium]|jgi:spermidine synthase|nr:hypothetical protein [bacterium]MBT4250917.1 hypothetical protein [bacterium]MBT4597895.1 hypothetical protein [bacterium]MBT6753913.1 hypothetical protein [bacterium]MBT7037342.1 hypothetical protein [bacterium]